MAIIVRRAGKALAPHLKSVLGCWLCSQFDPHREAASVAKAAFQDTFPAPKDAKTLAFGMEDVLVYVKQHILVTTAASLMESGDDAKEAELKHQRMVMTALLALANLFSRVPAASSSPVAAEILGAKALWKMAQAAVPQVAAALADCTASAAKHCGTLLEPMLKKASTFVFQ